MLPEYPAESIAAVSGKLTRLWRDRDGRRNPRPDVKDTIVELVKRGFNLGIIANTITETEIPDWIIDDGLVSCFYPVILSSKVRIRKPDPSIYLLAARILGVEPSECAYIGDNPVRDVEGARKSEFGSVILINEPNTVANETEHIVYEPDYTIDKISDLLNIFPRAHGCLRAEKTTP
jgi:FMN phosphatase YigB (HAD superfamily)